MRVWVWVWVRVRVFLSLRLRMKARLRGGVEVIRGRNGVEYMSLVRGQDCSAILHLQNVQYMLCMQYMLCDFQR